MQNTYCLEKLKVKQHSSQKFWPTSVGKSRQISAHSSLYLTLPCNNIFSRSKQETQRVLEWRSCNNKTLESRMIFRVTSPALLDVCFKRCPHIWTKTVFKTMVKVYCNSERYILVSSCIRNTTTNQHILLSFWCLYLNKLYGSKLLQVSINKINMKK